MNSNCNLKEFFKCFYVEDLKHFFRLHIYTLDIYCVLSNTYFPKEATISITRHAIWGQVFLENSSWLRTLALRTQQDQRNIKQ